MKNSDDKFTVVMELAPVGGQFTLAGYVLNDNPPVGFTPGECLIVQKRLAVLFKHKTYIMPLNLFMDLIVPHYLIKDDTLVEGL